jgi:hypothetical protein
VKGRGYQESGARPHEETAACHQDMREVHLTGVKVHLTYFCFDVFIFPHLYTG